MQNKMNVWLSVFGVAILLLIGIFFFRMHTPSTSQTSTEATSTLTEQAASTTNVDLGNGVVATVPSGVTITESSATTIVQPNLNHVVTYSSDLPLETVTALKNQIAIWVTQLKANPSKGDIWLQLAVDYKIAGDLTAAENVWIYMTKVAPTSPVAFQDLGDLYQNFEVNYPKAETNYLAAVKLDPTNIDLYSDLYTLYRYQENNPTAAANIVAQGLKANPNNSTLLTLQSQLQSGQ